MAGHTFSDMLGSANVANNHPAYLGADILTLVADSTVPNANDSFPLTGFSVGAYTLKNVRLFWMSSLGGAGNFLADNTLPAQPPSVTGRLALDFVRVGDVNNPAGQPSTVFFEGLTARPMTAAVPEPGSYALMLAGLGVLGFAARARQKHA